MNYTKIKINYSIDEIYNDKTKKKESIIEAINNILKRFIGAETILVTQNKIEIELMIYPLNTEERFEEIEKRTFNFLKNTLEEAIELIGKDNILFSKRMNELHNNLTRLINCSLRELNNSDKPEFEKISGYSFYSLLDTLVDRARDLSEKINENNSSEKIKNILKNIFENFIEEYFIIISKETISNEFLAKKQELKKKINLETFTSEENKIILEIISFLDSLNISSEYMLARSLNK